MHGSTYEARCLTRKENPRKWLKQNNSTKCPCFHCTYPQVYRDLIAATGAIAGKSIAEKAAERARWSASLVPVLKYVQINRPVGLNLGGVLPVQTLDFVQAWIQNRVRASTSLYFTLVSWHIWKERNGRGLYFNYTIRFVMMIYLHY